MEIHIQNRKKGFTLAELLVVVAIVAILAAISIPIFTRQLEASREATDLANVRSAYAEVMARVFKAPVTGFLTIGILPLVPGGGIYYTMEYCVSGETSQFIETGIHTFAIAGALAIGVLVVSSLVRLFHMMRLYPRIKAKFVFLSKTLHQKKEK